MFPWEDHPRYWCRCHKQMGNDYFFLPPDRCLYETKSKEDQMRPSDKKLHDALLAAKLPDLAAKAAAGYYNEFFGPLDTPIVQLVTDLQKAGAHTLAKRVMNGEFDAGKDESDEWAKSQGLI